MALSWSKRLTDSDAQQDTEGGKMPFLRFTKEGTNHDHRTWFRDVFFADAEWTPSTSQRARPIEEAKVDVRVVILGDDLGIRRMRLDHDPARAENHSAPTTHLHYDNKTRTVLESMNLTGRVVVVERADDGEYSLEVQ